MPPAHAGLNSTEMNIDPMQSSISARSIQANCDEFTGVLLLFIALCAGCSTHVAPTVQPAGNFRIPDFTCQPVNVINAQPATGDVVIGRTGTGMGQIPKSVHANLHEWTETAGEILKRELQKRTVASAGKSPKVLRLAVTRVEVLPVVFLGGNQYKIHLKVETGDGTIKDFDEEYVDTKRSGIEEIGGTALAKAIAFALNDDSIRSYLRD